MSVTHQIAVLVCAAASALTDAHEGCLVTIDKPMSAETTATLGATEGKLCGVLLNVADPGSNVDVAIPGFSGILECRASADYGAITPGTLLTANSVGTFKAAAAGDVVYAVAVTAPTEGGALFDATLCPPFLCTEGNEEDETKA